MSTQHLHPTIPLYHPPAPSPLTLLNNDQDSVAGYKLLELPPDLVALLEGEDTHVLTISPSPTSAILQVPNSTKTYSLRQKNTSNSLIILSPTTTTTTSSPDTSGDGTAVKAIATLHETVELVPVPESSSAAGPEVKKRGKWHEKFARGR
ncbi:hypothetical protein QBC40DRAFT_339870 [Triangularia verruculosa]|uniref:Sister chromatid cohesion protein DCC1 n=1 Tax=Triangularia verruculosa TaxID=2587418 RepID=A0AAN6XHI9_9PEZI|nr:hypothetical protein QBC40DRAFT_339870 [Triangularia verruculosa]